MKRFKGTFVFVTALLLLTACSSVSTSPEDVFRPLVTFGSYDGEAHPHVGTLLFVQNGVGYYSCSGTLLSPTVMLTAGHCVEGEGQVNEVTYVRFEPDALAGLGDYRNTETWLKREWIRAEAVIAHPRYDDFAEFPNTYDIGLVILSKPVELETYGALPELGLLDRILEGSRDSDKLFTAVGYGLQGVINPFYGDEYSRRRAETSLIEVVSDSNGDDQGAKFSNSPGGGNGSGGVCFGDSGGPVFHGDSNVIGAIVSWGITPCIGVDYQFRVDTQVAQEFVTPYLSEGGANTPGKPAR